MLAVQMREATVEARKELNVKTFMMPFIVKVEVHERYLSAAPRDCPMSPDLPVRPVPGSIDQVFAFHHNAFAPANETEFD